MYQDVWDRFIKKDCRYLDATEYRCRLAEKGVSTFPSKECYDCLVALHRLRVEKFRVHGSRTPLGFSPWMN